MFHSPYSVNNINYYNYTMKRQTFLKSTLCFLMALVCNVVWAEAPVQAQMKLTGILSAGNTVSYHDGTTSGNWYGKLVKNTSPNVTFEVEAQNKSTIGWSTRENIQRPMLQAGENYIVSLPEGYLITGYTLVTQSTTANNKDTFKYTTADGLEESALQTTSNSTITVDGLSTNQIEINLTEYNKSGTNGIMIWDITLNYTVAGMPYVSNAPSNGAWDANTTWYQLKLRNGRVVRADVLTGEGYLALTNTTTTNGDAGLWCIVGNANDGYKFYNRAKGANVFLGMMGDEDNGLAVFVDANTTGYTTAFDFVKSNNANYWCVKDHGTPNKYWNYRNPRLAYWNTSAAVGNDGSDFLFTQVDLSTITGLATEAEIEAAQALIKVAPGYPKTTTNQYRVLDVIANSPTKGAIKTELDAAVAAYKACTNILLPEDGKAYTFTLVHTDKAEYKISVDANKHLQATTDGTAATFYCHAFMVGNEQRYVFISEEGKILAYQTVTDTYTIVGNLTNDFTAGGMYSRASNDYVTSTQDERFGLIYLTAKARAANNATAGSIIYKPTGATAFDNSADPYHNATYTSAIKATEVPGYTINDVQALALAKVKAKVQIAAMKLGSYVLTDKNGVTYNSLTTADAVVEAATTTEEIDAFIASRSLNLPTPGKAYYLKDSQGTYLDIHHLVVEANDAQNSTQLASLSKTKQILYITGSETDGTWKIHTTPEGGKYLHQKPSSRVWNSWVSDAGGDFKWEVEGVDVSGTPHYMLKNISGSENGILGPNNSNHTNAGEPLFVNQQNDAQKLKLQLLPVKSITTEFVPVAAEWLNEECVDVASENVPAGAKFPVEADHADYASYKSSVVTSGEYFYLKKGCLTGVFNWRNNSGSKRVNIVAVEVVDLAGAVAAADYHYGYAGNPSSNNTYTVDIPEDGLYYIRYYAEKKSNGGVNNSDIDITYTYMSKRIVKQDLYNTSNGSLEVPPYRIPGITVDPETGRIITTAARLVCGTDPGYGQVDVVCRISDDHGATWSDMKEVAVGNESLCTAEKNVFEIAFGDPAIVADRTSNEVLIIAVAGCTVYGNSKTTRQNPNMIATIHSTDNGLTWGTPVNVTEDIYSLFDSGNPIQSAFVGGGKVFQSRIVKKGDYYRLYAAMCARPNGNRVIYSDDFGRTWHALGGAAALPAPGGDEPKCEELPDGRVILSSRVGGGRIYNIYTYSNTLTAEGSWGTDVKSTFEGSGKTPGGNSTNGEMLIVPVQRNSDGAEMYLALQSLPTGSGRSNVGIFYKELADETDISSVSALATGWNGFFEVTTKSSAYSSMDLQADNRIGFIYEETLTRFGTVNNPVSTNFPTGEGQHNYDGYDNIYVAYPLEIITNNAYSIKRDVDRREFLRSYFTDLTADVADELKAAVADDLATLSAEPTIAEVDGIYFNIGKEDIITAFDAHIGGKIGHYTDAAVTAYKAAVVAAETAEELTSAKNAVLTSDNWNKPVGGKAYTFKNVQKDGTTVRWYKYDGNNIVLTANESEATPFVCRLLENGKYVFVCNGGKYMTWRASVTGCTTTGVHDGYHGEGRFLTDITITKMTSGGQIASGVDLSNTRYISISAKRPDKDEMGYVVVKKNNGSPTFDGAGAAYYNDSYSSAFIMEEAPYANTFVVECTIGEYKIATFYANDAMNIPSGVKAYVATTAPVMDGDNGIITMTEIKDGIIPAKTGAVLRGEPATYTFEPATETGGTEVTGNLLHGYVGIYEYETVALPNDGSANYVLTVMNGKAGFYRKDAGFKVYNNKAYLNVPGAAGARALYFEFDNGATGIVETENESEKAEIYDLTGRRVQKVQKGLYIVNGKKVWK